MGGRDKPGHDGLLKGNSTRLSRALRIQLALACAVLALATTAAAQDRPPAERQTVIDLAYVLGESHALRQVCEGAGDQYWRERMQQLVRTETPDADFDRRLKDSFNTGFIAGQSAFASCGRASRREADRLAERGRALSASLTSAMANDEPPR